MVVAAALQAHQPATQSIQNQTDGIAGIDFFHHGAAVGLHGAWAQEKLLPDLDIGEFLKYERQYLQLTATEGAFVGVVSPPPTARDLGACGRCLSLDGRMLGESRIFQAHVVIA